MKRISGKTVEDIRMMDRVTVLETILGPDWAEDEQGRPKFLGDLLAAQKYERSEDPYQKIRDGLLLKGIPEHRVDEVIAQSRAAMQALYEAAGVKKKVY